MNNDSSNTLILKILLITTSAMFIVIFSFVTLAIVNYVKTAPTGFSEIFEQIKNIFKP